jgi:hypothetical protein
MATTLDYIATLFGFGLPLLTYVYLSLTTLDRGGTFAKDQGEPRLPESIPPALAGLYFDGKLSENEIAATIVDLMERKYLNIVEKGENIVILKQKPTEALSLLDRVVAERLIEKGKVAKSELEIERKIGKKLYDDEFSQALRTLYREGVKEAVFADDPNERYTKFYLVGLLAFFVGLFTFPFLLPKFSEQGSLLFFPFGLILGGTILIDRAKRINAWGPSGEKRREAWRQFRQNLVSFRPDRERDSYLTLLPYAFALGCEKEWTAVWSDRAFQPPEWFVSFKTPSRREFLERLSGVVSLLARDLFSTRDPALKD